MYSTLSDILNSIDEKKIIDLLNDESRSYDEVDLSDQQDQCRKRLDKAILDAKQEIDGYLRTRYDIKSIEESMPLLIRSISDDLSIYNCYKRRFIEDMPESIMNVYKAKIKLLEKISDGSVNLGVENVQSGGNSSEVVTNKTDYDRLFNKDLMDRFLS